MLFPRLRRLSRVQSDSPRGLHGNARKNLSILSLERLLWKRTLSRILRSFFPFLSYPTLNLSRVFSPREALSTSADASLAAKRKKREGKREEREAESVAVSLKEVYFANKTGPLLCVVLIETIKNHPRTGGVREPFKMAPLSGYAKRICQKYVHWL